MSQIADRITGTVEVRGVRLDLRDLLQGMLITGGPGCGKTTTLLNPLLAALAAKGSRAERPAVIYFAAKGVGHTDFIARLPPERRRDVVVVGADREQHRLELFPAAWWSQRGLGAHATVEYVLELARHISGSSDRVGAYKAYWDGIWLRVLRTLAGLTIERPPSDGPVEQAADASSLLVRLLGRCRMLSDHLLHAASESTATPTTEAGASGSPPPTKPEEIVGWLSWIGSLDAPTDVTESLRAYLLRLAAGSAGSAPQTPSTPPRVFTDLQRLAILADEDSRARLRDLVRWLVGSRDHVSQAVLGDLSSIQGLFEGVAGLDLGTEGSNNVTIEDAVHHGKILVIDLPVAGSGGGSRSAMVAAQLATFTTLLARSKLRRDSGLRMNSTRPVVVALDEFHTICSRGRDSGLGRFLSQAREFGVITVAATQHHRLIAEALEDWSAAQALIGVIGTHAFGRTSESMTVEFALSQCPEMPDRRPGKRPLVLGFADVPEDFREMLCASPGDARVQTLPSHIRDLQFGEFLPIFYSFKTWVIGDQWVTPTKKSLALHFLLRRPVRNLLNDRG
jgi:hypothetical protein